MSGYASKAEAMGVVRATIASASRPADLPDDLSAYILSRIYSAVVSSRGPGYGWAIEYDPTVFWDAVRANLRTPIPEPGMSWGEVAERDAAGYCPASLDYNEPHIADGNVCSECGADLEAPLLAPTLGPITNVGIMADRVLYRVVVTYPGEKSKDVDFNGPANSEGVGPVVMISGYSQILIDDPSRFGPFGPEWIRRFFA